MSISLSLTFGLLFLITSFAAVFVVFRLCGYAVDEQTGVTTAPVSLQRLYRVLGWAYVGLYLLMMAQMLPRLWEYQVELPPRTVAHVGFAFIIGVVVMVKLSILRWYKILEEWVPVLEVLLLTSTILLSALSVPFALHELRLARGSVGGGVYSAENQQRVAELLPQAGLPAEAPLAELASEPALRAGRDILAGKCVVCHDLKTILTQPRSPSGWWGVVDRMIQKPGFSEPITDFEGYEVTAYLIAISGDLQRSVREQRKQKIEKQTALAEVQAEPAAGVPTIDPAKAEKTYERVCSQCHELGDVDAKPPRSADEVRTLIERMISDNDMQASKEELDEVYVHMVKKFAGGAA